jgi:uncharacterized protein (DUF1800 family)
MHRTFAMVIGLSAAAAFLPGAGDADRTLHVLQRLTWGAAPADIEAVNRIGVERWIELQLHPGRIAENPILLQRLEPLETLRMTSAELVQQHPPPQLIRAYAQGRVAMPQDEEERARIEALVEQYNKRRRNAGEDKDNRQSLAQVLTPDERRTLLRASPEEKARFLAELPPARFREVLAALPQQTRRALAARAPVELRRKLLSFLAPQQVLASDLMEAKLYRAVYSNRQLEDVLTDFWFNHFNVFLDKGADRFLVTSYERDAIRPHVLARFRDLLGATAHHPAMLFYLDNWQSVSPNAGRKRMGKRARGINENYARELLELHTLGVDGGYTQQDVAEVARAFTGWTIREPFRGASFEFNARAHDNGAKTILGLTLPAGGGQQDGEKVLDLLSRHPSTAQFISRKLAQRFVADNPPLSLVDAMAATFRKTDGDLRKVLQTMLNAREFWAPSARRAKIKSPFEAVVSSLRVTGADVDSAAMAVVRVGELGQPLYRKQEPTGYPNTGDEWISSAGLLGRINFAMDLASDRIPGVKMDARALPNEPGGLSSSLLLMPATSQTQTALKQAVDQGKDKATLISLVLGSPEFQRK